MGSKSVAERSENTAVVMCRGFTLRGVIIGGREELEMMNTIFVFSSFVEGKFTCDIAEIPLEKC